MVTNVQHQLGSIARTMVLGRVGCWLARIVVICLLASGGGEAFAGTPAPPLISVQDLVRVARIGDSQSLLYTAETERLPAATISPSRSHAAVLVRWGDPNKHTNIAALYIYSVKKDGSRKLSLLFTNSASGNIPPIAILKWRDDRNLMFAATDVDGRAQVFTINIDSAKRTQLTHERDLADYDVSGDKLLVFNWSDRLKQENDPRCQNLGCLVTAGSFLEEEDPSVFAPQRFSIVDLHTQQRIVPDAARVGDREIEECPSGTLQKKVPAGSRYLIWDCVLPESKIPVAWTKYAQIPALLADGGDALLGFYQAQHIYRFGRLYAVNVATGAFTPLLDAPFSMEFGRIVYIDHGKRIALIGALEPPTPTHGLPTLATKRWFVLVVDPKTGTWSRIAELDPRSRILDASWDDAANTLIIKLSHKIAAGSAPFQILSLREVGPKWFAKTAPMDGASGTNAFEATHDLLNDGSALEIQEGLSLPPRLVLARRTGSDQVVLDPNEWVKNRVIGRIEKLNWRLKDGRKWSGILFYPTKFDPLKRYPLLLQAHGIYDNFQLGGVSRNYPGEALAAADMFVLQVADVPDGQHNHDVGPKEWTSAQAALESAIDELNSRGLIDRDRVSIIGWSRTGLTEARMLTHSEYRFAAAAFTDTGALGYWWYLGAGTGKGQEDDFGADTPLSANGLAAWLEMSPGFHMDRVRTPSLMWEDGAGPFGLWDWYAGLRRLSVPVEYWYLPKGTHNLLSVDQRIQTIQLIVDWFRFWLKNEIDPSPAKKAQYQRWRAMEVAFDPVRRSPRPRLVKWKATFVDSR